MVLQNEKKETMRHLHFQQAVTEKKEIKISSWEKSFI